MIDFIATLEAIAPTWPSVAEITAKPPYILYAESDEPIVTYDGIAGYDSTLSITVVERSKSQAQTLRDRVINALHGVSFADSTFYYDSSRYIDYADENLSGYEITLKWIK
jgi:hypothetical protein